MRTGWTFHRETRNVRRLPGYFSKCWNVQPWLGCFPKHKKIGCVFSKMVVWVWYRVLSSNSLFHCKVVGTVWYFTRNDYFFFRYPTLPNKENHPSLSYGALTTNGVVRGKFDEAKVWEVDDAPAKDRWSLIAGSRYKNTLQRPRSLVNFRCVHVGFLEGKKLFHPGENSHVGQITIFPKPRFPLK